MADGLSDKRIWSENNALITIYMKNIMNNFEKGTSKILIFFSPLFIIKNIIDINITNRSDKNGPDIKVAGIKTNIKDEMDNKI